MNNDKLLINLFLLCYESFCPEAKKFGLLDIVNKSASVGLIEDTLNRLNELSTTKALESGQGFDFTKSLRLGFEFSKTIEEDKVNKKYSITGKKYENQECEESYRYSLAVNITTDKNNNLIGNNAVFVYEVNTGGKKYDKLFEINYGDGVTITFAAVRQKDIDSICGLLKSITENKELIKEDLYTVFVFALGGLMSYKENVVIKL
jgi:hypothetical protein